MSKGPKAGALAKLLLVSAIVLVAAVGGSRIASATTTPVLRPVVLPRDHGAHPQFSAEWWYTAGTLADAKGRGYFWFATVWSSGQAEIAKVNVVDLGADRIVLSHEYVRAAPLAAGQTQLNVQGLRLGWRPAGALGRWAVDAPTGSGGALALALTPRQPYVLNGHHGIIEEGPAGASAYYSDPRLAARGTLDLDGKRLSVTGQGWFDHQWGNFASELASVRWNWFACQFDDGRDLMLYQFLNRDSLPSGLQNGTFVARNGAVDHDPSFAVAPLGPYIRPAGAPAIYPLGWRIEVPSAKIDITIRARARHQFIANQIVPSFWEGAASIVSGSPGTCIVESVRGQ